MSDVPQKFDPYAPPIDVQPVTDHPDRTPGGLKAICIIAMVLGCIGALRAMLGGVGLAVGQVAGQQMQELFTLPQQPGMDKEMEKAQEEYLTKVNDVTNQFLPFSIARVCAHFLTAVLLFVGGVLTIKQSARGRSLLVAACGLAILYEIGKTALNIAVQLRVGPLLNDFMKKAMQSGAGPQNQNAPPDWLPQVMEVAVYAGVAFGVAVALVKITFYLISLFYLRRSNIVAVCE